MGYLDRGTTVLDLTLTEAGRRLYAAGELEFSFFAIFDDLIDYDHPAELTDEERELMIETTPIPEAPSVPEVRGPRAPLSPRHNVFTAAPGYTRLPAMVEATQDLSVSIEADQEVVPGGYVRTGTSLGALDLEIEGDSVGQDGFILTFYSSGSLGPNRLLPKRDLGGRIAIDPFVGVSIDADPTVESGLTAGRSLLPSRRKV